MTFSRAARSTRRPLWPPLNDDDDLSVMFSPVCYANGAAGTAVVITLSKLNQMKKNIVLVVICFILDKQHWCKLPSFFAVCLISTCTC